ncbi:hypothetical protein HO543_06045 [Streptococcus suis]|nr:hypothetical protein [Streptococcus suis]NQJ76912.1 hypothetical protein [Streptococcus suis]
MELKDRMQELILKLEEGDDTFLLELDYQFSKFLKARIDRQKEMDVAKISIGTKATIKANVLGEEVLPNRQPQRLSKSGVQFNLKPVSDLLVDVITLNKEAA